MNLRDQPLYRNKVNNNSKDHLKIRNAISATNKLQSVVLNINVSLNDKIKNKSDK